MIKKKKKRKTYVKNSLYETQEEIKNSKQLTVQCVKN